MDFVSLLVFVTVVEAELVENFFHIFNVTLGGKLVARNDANGLFFFFACFLVHGDAERTAALEHVEELAEWDVEDEGDDTQHMYPNQGAMTASTEEFVTYG